MPLANRMTPTGVPEATPARGTLMGNRGCLVDAAGRLARPWRGERWITCLLAFRGRRRTPLMAPGRYTELFFLDEATALAAGHRPCAECRRADAHAFRAAAGFGGERFGALDHALHAERLAGPWTAPAEALPDETMVLLEGTPWRLRGDRVAPLGARGVRTAAGAAGRRGGGAHPADGRHRARRRLATQVVVHATTWR